MKRVFIGVAVIFLMSLITSCNQEDKDADQDNTIIPVETVRAETGDLVIEKTLSGRTAPIRTTPVMLRSQGEVDKLEVENGDTVKEDDIIAKIKTQAGIQNIRAPKAGEIAQIEAIEGDAVSIEEPFALVIDTKKVKVTAAVTSNLRSLFKKEAKLHTIIEDNEYKAEITSISTMPDETGLYPIEGVIDNKDKVILPGMIAKLHIPESRVKDAIILPTEAIVEESEGTFIYIIKEEQAVKIEVTIKEAQSDQTAVEGDVEKGDQVVINGQLTLSDGIHVDVVKEGNKS